jgi:hypothetical protein
MAVLDGAVTSSVERLGRTGSIARSRPRNAEQDVDAHDARPMNARRGSSGDVRLAKK